MYSHYMPDFERSKTRDRALSFFWGSGIYEMVSRYLPINGVFIVTRAGRIRTHDACVMNPHA